MERSSTHIRSYVLRQGRVSNAQQRCYDSLMPQYGISYSAQTLSLATAFGRNAPIVLEIGFGMGETTSAIALTHSQNNYLAIEVHTPGVGALLKLVGERELTNLYIIQHDAVEVLKHMLPDRSLAGVHIFFPDPWPKKRHHKRRLIQPTLVTLLVQKLAADGYIHLATDWQDYAQHILAVLEAAPGLKNSARDFAPRPAYRGTSGFERKGLAKGHHVWDLVFHRK